MGTPTVMSARDDRERLLAVIAACAVGVVIASILVAVIVGELPEVWWVLVVPVGMLGGGVTAVVATALLIAARSRSTT